MQLIQDYSTKTNYYFANLTFALFVTDDSWRERGHDDVCPSFYIVEGSEVNFPP